MNKSKSARAFISQTNGNNETFFAQSQKLLKNRLRAKTFNRNNYQIVYMGDTWATSGNLTGVAVFNECLNVTRKTNPLLTLHGGDIVFTGNKDQFQFFVNKVKKRTPGIPLFTAVGNHESTRTNGSSLDNFKSIIGPKSVHFSLRLPFVKIIVVSSISSTGARPYGLSPSELSYLRQQLKSNAKNIIIATHVPPSAWERGKAEFNQLIKQKNVTLLLFSHEHEYKKFKLNGKTAIISGGAGAALNKNNVNHIVILTVRNGKITTEKVPVDWDLRGSTSE